MKKCVLYAAHGTRRIVWRYVLRLLCATCVLPAVFMGILSIHIHMLHIPVFASEFYIEPLAGTATVTADTLNVRSGPSREYSAIGTLHSGDTATVTGYVEDWYVIQYEEEEGYIAEEYVEFAPMEVPPAPEETAEETQSFAVPNPLLLGLSAAILIVIFLMGITLRSIRSSQEKSEEDIPITSHDDTNMHLGEISYDTFRLDIDPSFFDTDTIITQPESITEAIRDEMQTPVSPAVHSQEAATDSDLQTLDSKLEEATAQIAALQKEVEELKKIGSNP